MPYEAICSSTSRAFAINCVFQIRRLHDSRPKPARPKTSIFCQEVGIHFQRYCYPSFIVCILNKFPNVQASAILMKDIRSG
jgi:hypothetical protein